MISSSNLYKPAGSGIFASRKAHRLTYRSQRQSPYDRAISQTFNRRQRLGADGGIGDPIDKPKGMRWATFDPGCVKTQSGPISAKYLTNFMHLHRVISGASRPSRHKVSSTNDPSAFSHIGE